MSKKYGTIKVIAGCMYSGKTTELIREWERGDSIGSKMLVINYKDDTRYSESEDDDYLYSHNKHKIKCLRIKNLYEVPSELLGKVDEILINEGQFFSKLKSYVQFWCESLGKDIVVSGLDGDFEREKFGEILDLIPIADDFIKVTAYCALCKDKTKALFTMRISNEKEQVVIGADNYKPVCRKHYLENRPLYD